MSARGILGEATYNVRYSDYNELKITTENALKL